MITLPARIVAVVCLAGLASIGRADVAVLADVGTEWAEASGADTA